MLKPRNDTEIENVKGKCAPELFEKQARSSPDAVALIFDGGCLTYEELNRRANRLARYLRSLGVGPEMRVGICATRTPELIIGLLAVWKAGGGYVPLDPSYPVARLRYMLQDSNPIAVLTQNHLQGILASLGLKLQVLDLNDVIDRSREMPETDLLPATVGLSSRNLAYLIYTSGSTGTPKGTMAEHAGVANVRVAQTQSFCVDHDSRVLQFAPFSFDASVFEIAMALFRGAVLVLPSPAERLAEETLVDVITRYGITHATLPPAVLASLPAAAKLESLRLLVLAGEALSAFLVSRWARGRNVANAYGPTETTIWATVHDCKPDQPGDPPIGHAIANTQVHILNSQAEPQGAGIAGEICIGGAGVTRGYLNRPDLTAGRFTPDEFGAERGVRIYRTGDLGRSNPDGTIAFLGRSDFQVKVRGFRIELGEIEARLEEHPLVKQAVVVARDTGSGEKMLVGYYVPSEPSPDFAAAAESHVSRAKELRDFLASALPDYMVPPVLLPLEKLPLTSNGKVDRKALLAMPSAEPSSLEPQTEMAKAVARACSAVLGISSVPLNRTFLELGGSSLNATRAVAVIREETSLSVPVSELLGTATLLAIAEDLEKKKNRSQSGESVPLRRRSGASKILLAAYSQERVWFVQDLDPSNLAYHAAARIKFTGAFDRSALERALSSIVERHEIYRTTFKDDQGSLLQLIHCPWKVGLEEIDATEQPGALKEIARDLETPFDLESLPLVRWKLIKLGEQEHVLQIVEHHMVHDGWSFNVFLKELTEFYRYYAEGIRPEVDPSPFQFADFSEWQREWITSSEARLQMEYWAALLKDCPPLQLPTDRPRPSLQKHKGDLLRFQLDRGLEDALQAAARRHQTTLFMLFATAFEILLYKYSHQEEFCIGTAIANRRLAETKSIIGMLVNNLPLHASVRGDLTVAGMLRSVRQSAFEAYANQDVPFDKIVQAVNPVRDAGSHPLFQVMLSFHDSPVECAPLAHTKCVVDTALGNGSAKFDLNAIVIPPPPRGNTPDDHEPLRELLWEYNSDLFDPASARQMAQHYLHILEQVACNDGAKVSDITCLRSDEANQILYDWNQTAMEFPREICVHELIEAQTGKTPESIALVAADAQLTYRELNRRSNQLARYLRQLGVRPDERVGICCQRTPEMVIALLAVLKAGGAYVPLDPEYPEARLGQMMKDSAPAALLTQGLDSGEAAKIAESSALVDLDLDQHRWQGEHDANLERTGLSSGNLAYVIFTSGSTGLAKGVAIEHRDAVNFICWARTSFAADVLSRVLFSTSLSFDLSIYECLVPLTVGGTVTIVGNALKLAGSPGEVTLLNGVPSVMNVLLETNAIPKTVRVLNLAGEALKQKLLERIFASTEVSTVCNLYGPSETTTYSSWAAFQRGEPCSVNIGRPIANTQFYLLDHEGDPVPVGVEGEICIGGSGVVRGYLNRGDLTAARFVSDPFSKQPGARIYRTGDLGKWRRDGTIEFVGRNDFQVKLRGYRIELGEIEARLVEQPGVHEAVVVVREDAAGDKQLVAYYTSQEAAADSDLGAEQLRAGVAAQLPKYMVPSAYVRLRELPRTANRKLNRQALPSPQSDAYASSGFELPAGELESAVAGIWAEMLKVERVGRNDNFFAVGGHSLLGLRLIARLRQELGIELPISDLFAHPVLADFAQSLTGASASALEPIRRRKRNQPLPLSFEQSRLWMLAQMEGASTAYTMHWNMDLRGSLNPAALRQALDRILRRHEALRTTFVVVDRVPMQKIAPAEGCRFPLVEHDLRNRRGGEPELERLTREEADAPFDLETGPLIRGRLIRTGEQDYRFLITVHHIAADRWSMDVFMKELGLLYGAFAGTGQEFPPDLPVQYGDYALWQRTWADGELLRRQREYWKSTLKDAPALLQLPADHPRPARQNYRGACVPLVLDEELTRCLRELGQRHGTTLYMTLLAGWGALLGRLAGQQEIVIGTPVANRGRIETQGLIGFFVNTLALRLELAGAGTTAELLQRVRPAVLAAQRHADLPFEQVVEAVNPVRSLAHGPLFQVMFAWQSSNGDNAALDGLQVKLLPAPHTTAKSDLILSLEERDGRIHGELAYATALFEESTIRRHAAYFTTLLQGMVADEHTAVERLPLMSAAERQQVLHDWNQTDSNYEKENCLQELFEEQVRRTPEAVAAAQEEVQMSYGELNRRANRLAHYLRENGVRPDERVAICLERSLDLVIAQLAALKCGGAYVPVDPDFPAERKVFLIRDSAARVLLTLKKMKVPAIAGVRRINLETLSLAKREDRNPGIALTSDAMAYVMYTSGSTGQPKGVMVPHRAIQHLVLNNGFAQIESDDRVAFAANPAFDAATLEVWWPLLNGSRIVVIDQETLLEPRLFGMALQRHGITILWLTVGIFNQYASRLSHEFGDLRYLIVGGDALDPATIRGILHGAKPCHLLNGYGPTETTTFAATYEIRELDEEAQSVPIGTPIGNTRVYVLDKHREPVPVGVAGELYISGAGVARGYLNRPELTAESFLADPFADDEPARMYRTGDLGLWRADGTIEFLGRNDQQVKLRGFRIEMGEIEARLLECRGVKEAVVIVREDAPGEKRLVAYYTAKENQDHASSGGAEDCNAATLRAYLLIRLPEYMVPGAYVRMDSIPLTSNGKRDRKRLPSPLREAFAAERHEAPEGEVETVLAEIWRELLGMELVGRGDDFFELGGHSLLAMQLVNRIQDTLKLDVRLADVFAARTIKNMATIATSMRGLDQILSEEPTGDFAGRCL
jgi:amino acid adenylation domain-containing protein